MGSGVYLSPSNQSNRMDVLHKWNSYPNTLTSLLIYHPYNYVIHYKLFNVGYQNNISADDHQEGIEGK